MKYILLFSDKCPDTNAFVEKLKQLKIEYEEINITDSMKNLKYFLKLRDERPEYKIKKEQGYVGIPALIISEEKIIFDICELENI